VDTPPADNKFAAGKLGAEETIGTSRIEMLDEVARHQQSGDQDKAISILKQLLVRDSDDVEAIFTFATLRASQGRFVEAIELLDTIPSDHIEAGIPSLGASADWCLQLERYDDAELRYRKILEIAPSVNVAKRKLANLLNRQGRRHEAVALIRQLCVSGDVTQDELHSLIVESDAMYDEPNSTPEAGAASYVPIGKMGTGRYLYTQHRYLDAALEVEPLILSGEALPAMLAFYGCAVAEAQDEDRFQFWLSKVNQSAKEFPEYWAALGTHLIAEGKFDESVRALAEAIRRDPTDYRSIRRLVQAFRSLGDEELTKRFQAKYQSLINSVNASVRIANSTSPSAKEFEQLSKDLTDLDRLLEAILWKSVSAIYQHTPPAFTVSLQSEMRSVLDRAVAFPGNEQTLCNMRLEDFPLPKISSESAPQEVTKPRLHTTTAPPPAKFSDVSKSVGLLHHYEVGSSQRDKGFAIYQSLGGGVAVLDFDLDGFQDLYFAQGGGDPPDFVAGASDQLYRTTYRPTGMVLDDVTKIAGAVENRYTVGVTSGDWNQDGFPDMVTVGIGDKWLHVNNGDGTFAQLRLGISARTKLNSSLAMADLSGDQLPDLVVLSYVDDEAVVNRPEMDQQGNVISAIGPLDLTPAQDELFTNDGQGGWTPSAIGKNPKDASTGLGVIVTNLDESAGNEVFVGNDERANQLWVLNPSNNDWVDQAIPLGCAFSSTGAPTGSMGIACGDFDRTGSQDIHITNYFNESVCLYLNGNGLFRDKCVKYQLSEVSKSVLGFGCQAIDYSNDGRMDLVVTNGHVEDLEWKGQPFRQPMQLFANLGSQFQLVSIDDESSFWGSLHLGRAVAKLDFDRDGKMDFVLTDLLGPSKLLLNQTPTQNHSISLRLVGTTSERDAIGAKIRVNVGDQEWTQWVNAGDGYLCKNEFTLIFGLGKQDVTCQPEVEVTWPNGDVQRFSQLKSNETFVLVEGDSSGFQL